MTMQPEIGPFLQGGFWFQLAQLSDFMSAESVSYGRIVGAG
jgi:hypothetical protein